jgi:hypothetical protein
MVPRSRDMQMFPFRLSQLATLDVTTGDFFESIMHAWIPSYHGALCIGTYSEAGTDVAKRKRFLIDFARNVPFKKRDCEDNHSRTQGSSLYLKVGKQLTMPNKHLSRSSSQILSKNFLLQQPNIPYETPGSILK